MEELQQIVESLAERLGRSVAIDDPQIRLKAYSAHYGHVDKVRLESILTRSVPPEVASWAYSHKIKTAKEPVRIRQNKALGYDPRLCVPIRHGSELLGFLWLIDADGSLTDANIEAAVEAAESAADVMYRDRLHDDIRSARERELLRDLVSDIPEVRDQAAGSLLEDDLLLPAKSYGALVVRELGVDAAPAPPNDAIAAALEEVRARHSRRNVLYLSRPDHWLVVVAVSERFIRGGLMALAKETHELVARALERAGGGKVLVGVGDSHKGLTEIRDSYGEAQYAVRVGEVVSSVGPVVGWQQLGIYRMLIKFPVEELTTEALPVGLMRLLERGEGDVLMSTLETYLDLAGNVGATASTLNLHRVSLYARLRRIEDVAGINLANGQERLALHLGLKLARLAGIYNSPPPVNYAASEDSA